MINPAFIQKEIKELIKTPKLIIITAVFLFFSIIGPLTAKYMNELIAMFASDIEISFPDPTHLQSWEQFYSNITSISMIVCMIMMTGIVASEKNKGSIYLILTKNVTRTTFVLSKMIVAALLFTFVYVLSLLVSGYYTWILFDEVLYEGIVLALISVLLLGWFYMMLAVFISVVVKSTTHAALISFGIYALLNIFTILSDLNPFNPAGSAVLAMNQLTGADVTSEIVTNMLVTVGFIGLMGFLTIKIFKKQEL